MLTDSELLERLHELEISARSDDLLSKSSFTNHRLCSQKAERTLELVLNILDDKYQNGISVEFEEGGVSTNVSQTSVGDNVALAARIATEIQGLKR